MPRPLTRGADPVQSLRARGDEGPDGVASQRPRLLNGRAILVATLVLVAGACLGTAGFAAEQHYRHWLPKPMREHDGWRILDQHGRRFAGLSLSGTHLTWQDGSLILLMDLASGRVRVLGPGADNRSTWRSAVSDRYVVWFEGRSAGAAQGEAYAYDLDSRRRRAVAPVARPASYAATSGWRAVWTETTEGGGAVLRVLDLRTGALLGISSCGGEPVVDGSLVAVKRPGSSGHAISALDLRTRREWQVVAANGETMTGFAVSGRRVAWGWADAAGGAARVLTRDVDTGATALLAEATGLAGPAIDDDLVVWAEVTSGGSVIMGRRADGGAAFEIASTAGRVETVLVSGSTVAWLARESGSSSVIQTVSVRP